MANYKLLVLDLDGTLVNGAKDITQPTLDALRKAQQQGVRIVLASGRPTHGIKHIASQLDIASYGGFIMGFNGGVIVDAASGEVVYQSTLPAEVIAPLYEMTREAGVVISTYRDEFVVCEQPDDKYMAIEIKLTRMTPCRVESFVEAVDFVANKCLAVGDPQRLIPLQERVMERFSHCMNAFRSEPYFLELVPKGIDKALSLGRLIEYLGVDRSETVAVGDGFNDLSMIEFAGLGVAMANAQPEVKAVADYITLSNEEDGVAALVEKFILDL
ncbi:MAG: Cof-type HAD-IIB family hydrolase [Rikenellaceae bacterium]